MVLEIREFDAAHYITEPQDIFYFLEAELEQEEPEYWPGAIEIVARARGGFERLAEESGVAVKELLYAAEKCTPTHRADVVKLMEAYRPASEIIPPTLQAYHA